MAQITDPVLLRTAIVTELLYWLHLKNIDVVREDVEKVVTSVISDPSKIAAHNLTETRLREELELLSDFIRQAKQDIATIQPTEISSSHIPQATGELDAVVGATEEATNKIMDVCDDIANCAENLAPDIKNSLIDCTTRIFEACNFQDITGQRITKVVNALKHIDHKISALLNALGDKLGPPNAPKTTASPSKDPLLNGPQLPGQGVSQAKIDQLLSDQIFEGTASVTSQKKHPAQSKSELTASWSSEPR